MFVFETDPHRHNEIEYVMYPVVQDIEYETRGNRLKIVRIVNFAVYLFFVKWRLSFLIGWKDNCHGSNIDKSTNVYT